MAPGTHRPVSVPPTILAASIKDNSFMMYSPVQCEIALELCYQKNIHVAK
jgi:hypothetical protein